MKVYGHLVDIHNRDIYPSIVNVKNGRIDKIERINRAPLVYIIPGLIDSHIHIESSMITPGAFAMEAVKHGTTGVISDPHEIANVLGGKGIEFMMRDARKVPVRFWFGAPSCVPATRFETNGAIIDSEEIRRLLELPDIKYMAEMMNFPGIIFNDKEVENKLKIARDLEKPIDGHAPGLRGEDLMKYVASGISTDHECSTIEDAREKLVLGMKILIREGSAARNLDSLKQLFLTDADMVMLCSDDLHPEMLQKGHINKLIARLITEGYNVFDVIRSATLNPVKHYNIQAGMLQKGQIADFIIVDSLRLMNVIETWIGGKKVFADGEVLFNYRPGKSVNNFNCEPVNEKDIRVINKYSIMRLIEAFDGELLTKEVHIHTGPEKLVYPDIGNDILKIVVKDRYHDSPPVTGFIKGFGLKEGAFASSIAHDSHNIISIGTNDDDIVRTINEIVKHKGGLAVSSGRKVTSIQLNIGGIMTTRPCGEVATDYNNLNELVKSLGCKMTAPFMALSFMALLVIPDLKISDRGLFDVKKFEQVPLFLEKL